MFENFGNNIFQGVVSGIFTSIILWICFKLRDYFDKQKGLKELFKIKDLCKYTIMVPSFYVEKVKPMGKSKRAISARTDVPFFAKNDMKASSILYRLVKPFCQQVDIKEDEKFEFNANEKLICIGGSSNDVTWKTLEKYNPPVHYLRYKPDDLDEIRKNPEMHYSKYINVPGPFNECIYEKTKDNLYQEDQAHTYSLILKLSNSLDDGVVFIVCGLNSEGTLTAAEYLSNNWRKIRKDLIKKNKGCLNKILSFLHFYIFFPWKCPDFSIIIKINRNDRSIEQIYINQINC